MIPVDSLPHDVRLAVEACHADETVHGLLCPKCEGGRTGEHKLTLFGEGLTVSLRCWRASCTFNAAVLRVPEDGDKVTLHPGYKFKPRVFRGEYAPWSVEHEHWFRAKFPALINVRSPAWVVPTDDVPGVSYYYPVLSPTGAERGGQVRYYDGSTPKAKAYPATDQPWQAWYLHGLPATCAFETDPQQPLVVVEDQVSAMCAHAAGYDAVAILGTSLSPDRVEEIRDFFGYGYLDVRLALDRDAFGKATKAAIKHPWLRPVLLDKDLKDCTLDEIKEVLAPSTTP